MLCPYNPTTARHGGPPLDTYHAIVSKRDTRSFDPRPLPDDLLHRILQAGRMAGSAKAAEPVRFVVLRDAGQRAALAACGRFTPHLLSAPVVIAVVLVPEPDQPEGEFAIFRGPFDSGRAAQNMMVAAWAEGVASCPASLHDADAARKVLGMPPGHVVANTIAFGFPAGADPTTGQRPRSPLPEYVHWERWGGAG
ncbi:MAG: nitroreductase family protein [Tepidiformaceae bacterium]